MHLKAQRKKRSKRPMAAWEEFLSKPTRQYIETVFSKLSTLFARKSQEDPRGYAQRFRAEDRLLSVSLLHSMSVGGNSGHVCGSNLVSSHARQIDLIGPAFKDNTWQAESSQGFDAVNFRIEWE